MSTIKLALLAIILFTISGLSVNYVLSLKRECESRGGAYVKSFLGYTCLVTR